MNKSKSKKITATNMRNFLATLLVLIIVGSAAGFYFGLQIIKDYSLEVSRATTDANASGDSIQQLGDLKKQLADGQALVTKANQLFATPATYQTQALKDISKYATESDITISSINSTEPSTPGSGASGSSEVITIQSPVSYIQFLKFINAIEGNLPKMQITGISIERPVKSSGDLIVTDKITIVVSTR
jgi:hypothetical protein